MHTFMFISILQIYRDKYGKDYEMDFSNENIQTVYQWDSVYFIIKSCIIFMDLYFIYFNYFQIYAKDVTHIHTYMHRPVDLQDRFIELFNFYMTLYVQSDDKMVIT